MHLLGLSPRDNAHMLCCNRCENVPFFAPWLQLPLNCDLVKIGRCYCATTPRVCLSTGTKSTCSLATHLHLNEYDTDCLLSVRVCVWIFTFTIHHLLTTVSGFKCSCLCGTGADFCHTSEFAQMTFWTLFSGENIVCLHSVLVLFCWGLNWLRIWLIKSKHPLSIKLLDTLNSVMWLILLVCHQVNHMFGLCFYGCGYESVALFNTTEHCANLWFKWMDFMPRKPSTAHNSSF